MTHTALARRYRPRRFGELVAQDHVARGLSGAVLRNRVAHGYLFAGPRGVGKTTAARVLAMALNCAARTAEGEPCGTCESCERIWAGAATLDVVEIDAASNRGVDDARDLRERAMYAASAPGRSKVYIVDEAHMLTREAWNALLKILEEPPPGVVFVFATTEPLKIAQTASPVLSRLQRFDFRRIGPQAVVARLKDVAGREQIAIDDDALQILAASADGGMRDALSLLDQVVTLGDGAVTAPQVRQALGLVPEDVYGELLRLVVERDPAGAFPLVDRVVESGADLAEFAAGAGDVVRAVLLAHHGGEPKGLSEGLRRVVAEYRERLAAVDALRLLDLLVDAESAIRRGPTRLAVETLLLKWTMLDRVAAVSEVLAGLRGTSGGSTPPTSRTAPGRSPASGAVPERPHPTAGAAPGRSPQSAGATTERTPAPAGAAPGRTPAPAGATTERTPATADTASGRTPAPVPRGADPLPAPTRGPFTRERLVELWPTIVARAASEISRFLSAPLSEARVIDVSPPTITLALVGVDPVQAEPVTRQRTALEGVIAEYVDGPVRIQLAEGPPEAAGERRGRLTEAEAKAERLKVLRAKDPVLDQAADAWDLDIVD